MASMSIAIVSLKHYCSSCNYNSILRNNKNSTTITTSFNLRLPFSLNFKGKRRVLEHVFNPITSAAGSGVETTFTDPKDNAVTLKNAKVVVESMQENKIQLRVDVSGDETETAFSKVLANLARSAPPIPGFRREKGGKTSKVPRDFLLQVLGEERVTKFVIQEIVSSSVADYVKKENLNVKENKVSTIQEAEELKKLFAPGNDFGFNAVLELEETKTEASISDSSDS